MTGPDHPAAGAYYDHEAEYRKRRRRGWSGWEESFDGCEMEIFFDTGWLRAADHIFELGCGGGQAAIIAARHGCRVAACDASPTATEMARENLAAESSEVRSRIRIQCADILKPDFCCEGAPFDAVLDIHCFHGMVAHADRDRFLDVAWNHLKPGGRLLSANMCGLPHTVALRATVDLDRRISLNGTRYFAEEDEVRGQLIQRGWQIAFWQRRVDPHDVDYLLFVARRPRHAS